MGKENDLKECRNGWKGEYYPLIRKLVKTVRYVLGMWLEK